MINQNVNGEKRCLNKESQELIKDITNDKPKDKILKVKSNKAEEQICTKINKEIFY